MKIFAIISAVIAGLMFLLFGIVAKWLAVKGTNKETYTSAVLMVLMGIWLMTAICLACVA